MKGKKSFFKKNAGPLLIVLVILIVLLASLSVYLYKKSRTDAQKNSSEVQSIVNKVGKLIYLPTDETPTVATVSDPEALKNQTFFVNAKIGDKVLIYTNAKEAILYDPIVNKIVTMAPLNIGDQKLTTQNTATQPATKTSDSKSSSTTEKNSF